MICPKCGGHAHRSHSRNILETTFKKVSSYKTYRCGNCGWRGMIQVLKKDETINRGRLVLFWIAGILLALAIGAYATRQIKGSSAPSAYAGE